MVCNRSICPCNMNPDRGIVRMYRRSDGLSTKPDDPDPHLPIRRYKQCLQVPAPQTRFAFHWRPQYICYKVPDITCFLISQASKLEDYMWHHITIWIINTTSLRINLVLMKQIRTLNNFISPCMDPSVIWKLTKKHIYCEYSRFVKSQVGNK